MADRTLNQTAGNEQQFVVAGQHGFYSERLHRRKATCEMLGISSSTLTDYVNQGIVPKPVRLNPGKESAKHGSVAWRESELLAYINSRPRAE